MVNYPVRFKEVWGLLRAAADSWVNDNAARLGAALSFYTIFALSPLFIIVIFIASLFFNRGSVREALFKELSGLIGARSTEALQSTLSSIAPHSQGVLASAIAIGTLLLTATGLFIELQSDLNTVWGVEAKPGQSIWSFVRNRLLSFAMVVAVGFLLLVSLIISAVLAALGTYFSALVPGLGMVWLVANGFASFAVITLLFALMFKILPDVKIAWRDVWIGAVTTALLFTGGKFLIGLYLGRNSTVSAYGAAGSLVLLLLWVYYSAQIMFFGAEVTQAYANRFGAHLQPKEHAQWILPPERFGSPAVAKGAQSKAALTTRSAERKAKLLAELQSGLVGLRAAADAVRQAKSQPTKRPSNAQA